MAPGMYMVPFHMASSSVFWISVVMLPLLQLSADLVILYWTQKVSPDELIKRAHLLLDGKEDTTGAARGRGPSGDKTKDMTGTDAAKRKEYHLDIQAQLEKALESGDERALSSAVAAAEALHLDSVAFGHAVEKLEEIQAKKKEGGSPQRKLLNKQASWRDHPPKSKMDNLPESWQDQPSLAGEDSSDQVQWKPNVAARWILCIGLACIFVGACKEYVAQSISSFGIKYDSGPEEPYWLTSWLGISDQADYTEVCRVTEGQTENSCDISVRVPSDMQPPILVYYTLTPFLQGDTRFLTLPQLRLNSFFNDTFEVVGHQIEETNIAWPSDVSILDVMGHHPGTAEHFAVWNRPAALPAMRKRYGYLASSLTGGDNVTVRINASFPVDLDSASMEKQVFFTTLNQLGGKNLAFARFFEVSGVLCFLAAMWICVMERRSKVSAREPPAPAQKAGFEEPLLAPHEREP